MKRIMTNGLIRDDEEKDGIHAMLQR